MTRKAVLTLIAAGALAVAAPGWSQEGQGSIGGSSAAHAAAAVQDAQALADAQSQARAGADLRAKMDAIQSRATKVSAEARQRTGAKLDAAARSVNQQAQEQGAGKVASRLAAEFRTTAQALASEQSDLQASWGDLMIAHTLDASARADVTVGDLVEMHQEGMGWGQIAAGLGLDLNQVVGAVRAETSVASGVARADGRVAAIGGAGAAASAGVNTSIGGGTSPSGTGGSVGVGAGVRIGGR